MKISKNLKTFLKDNYTKYLLLNRDYNTLYKIFKNSFTLSLSDLGTFNTLLYKIGEDPLVKFTYVPNYFLYGSDLEYFHIPENIVKINGYAFNYCENLKNIKISSNVKEIGAGAFEGCKSLTKIELPNSVEKISDEAFSNCKSLISINIPATVIFLGDEAFKGCEKLRHINYGGTKDQWQKLNNGKNTLYQTQKVTIHCADSDLNIG